MPAPLEAEAQQPPPGATRERRQRRTVAICLVLLSGWFCVVGLRAAWVDSATFDEPVYTAAGVAAWLHHDVALNSEHPLLPKLLAALPVLAVDPVVPANGNWDRNDEHVYSARFLQAQESAGLLTTVTVAARVVPLAWGLALALALYGLGRALAGRLAGLGAAALWLTAPMVLGFSHLLSLDVATALCSVLVAWALWNELAMPNRRHRALVVLATWALLCTSAVGLPMAVVALGVLAYAERRTGLAAVLRHVIVGALAIVVGTWALYAAINPSVLQSLPGLLPGPYRAGISYLATHDTVAAPSYVLGIAFVGGRWWFWPAALLVKVVPTTLVLLVLGLFGWRWRPSPARRSALLCVVLPALVVGLPALLTPRDLGIRYLLPTLALWLAVACAGVASFPRPALRRGVLAGAVALSLASAMTVVSTSLTYASPLASPAWRMVTNSDVDWGQGLSALDAFAAHHDVAVSYFGPRGATVTAGPGVRPLDARRPSQVVGWVAVSATNLTSAEADSLSWLRRYCPVQVLVGSILLYDFASPPTSAKGPAQPAALCPAGTASIDG